VKGLVILLISLHATEIGDKGLSDGPLGLSADFCYHYNSLTII